MKPESEEVNQQLSEPVIDEDFVKPLCCCYYSLTKIDFFVFISIWDLVFGILNLFSDQRSQNIFSVLIIVCVVMSYISYRENKSIGNCMNKLYAIARLILVLIELVFTLGLGIMLLSALLMATNINSNLTPDLMIIAVVTIFLFTCPLLIIGIQWSLLLKRIVNEAAETLKSKVEPIKEGLPEDNVEEIEAADNTQVIEN